MDNIQTGKKTVSSKLKDTLNATTVHEFRIHMKVNGCHEGHVV